MATRRFRTKLHLTAIFAVLLSTFALTAAPAHAYDPGKAVVNGRPTYDAYTGHWKYSCSFTGWRSGVKVVYHCELWERNERTGNRLLEDTKGNWTPGATSKTVTATEPVVMGLGIELCVKARALSVDGGVKTGLQHCYFV